MYCPYCKNLIYTNQTLREHFIHNHDWPDGFNVEYAIQRLSVIGYGDIADNFKIINNDKTE